MKKESDTSLFFFSFIKLIVKLKNKGLHLSRDMNLSTLVNNVFLLFQLVSHITIKITEDIID